ncbi:MAG: hypothetical protein ACREEM_56410 [Blastocatellia bacterium]
MRLADLNLAAMIRHRMQTTPNSLLREQDGALLFTIERPAANGHLNGALRINAEADAGQVLDQARSFFQLTQPDFMIWVRDEQDADLEQALRDAGFTAIREPGSPCMVLQRRLGPALPSAGTELCRVADARDVADYAQVMVAAFGMTEDVAQAVFGETASLVAPHVAAFIARQQNVPVAAAMTLITGEVAGIYFVGTVPEARGQGLGKLRHSCGDQRGLRSRRSCRDFASISRRRTALPAHGLSGAHALPMVSLDSPLEIRDHDKVDRISKS